MTRKKESSPGDATLELRMKKLMAEIELIREQAAHTQLQAKQISKPWWKREPIAALTLFFTVATSLITNIGFKQKTADIDIKITPEASQPKEHKKRTLYPWMHKDSGQDDKGLWRSGHLRIPSVRLAEPIRYYDPLADRIEKIATEALQGDPGSQDPESLKAGVIKALQNLKETEMANPETTPEASSEAIDKLIKRIERS